MMLRIGPEHFLLVGMRLVDLSHPLWVVRAIKDSYLAFFDIFMPLLLPNSPIVY